MMAEKMFFLNGSQLLIKAKRLEVFGGGQDYFTRMGPDALLNHFSIN